MLTVRRLLLPQRFSLVEIVHNPWPFDGKWVTQSIDLAPGKRELVGIRIAKGLIRNWTANKYGEGKRSTTPAVQ